eukprot:CAMPEP_0202961582 /NCGR_PEP_ID=MMETSP1396-20130829/5644_1 /ASSEMBLY_ACC=CAM_ASM_000872 /TAXON_ID= /ORGANISM="Pseudokeronopsis sp., Strain Brazil" /LENGTH=112 /DNA_ID=CAMNT_0049681507 /DNA_START=519 /DNA_END=857 /DNA_ORIENTATION=-
MEVAHNDFIDVQLDMGGKNQAYVAQDANFDQAVEEILKQSFYNSGQMRTAVQTIYLHQNVATDFTNEFSRRAFERLKLGDPMDPATNVGPIALPENQQVLTEFCEDAISMGG